MKMKEQIRNPMQKESLEKIKDAVTQFPQVKLAYLFGSQVRGTTGPLSDYDIAVYLADADKKEMFALKLKLMTALSRAFETDKVDVVVLNLVDKPELKYAVITEGELVHEVEPYKLLVEPRVLNEYFDFITTLRKYNLTGVELGKRL